MAEAFVPEIIYEDRDVVVAVKPAGVISEACGDGNVPSLPSALSRYFSEKSENTDIFPVHRLDTGTRGLMVFARTKRAAAALSEDAANGRLVKEYEALVNGHPGCDEGGRELCDLLFKDSSKNKVYVVERMRKGVREARLVYNIKEEREDTSLLRIRLITGRTHQIRVQFASRGFPLCGDKKYGARDGSSELGLCAVKLSFSHPVTGEALAFEIESSL